MHKTIYPYLVIQPNNTERQVMRQGGNTVNIEGKKAAESLKSLNSLMEFCKICFRHARENCTSRQDKADSGLPAIIVKLSEYK